jgi:hypothetical protein
MLKHGSFSSWGWSELQAKVGSILLPSHLEYTFILFPSFLSNFRNSIDTGALVCFLGPLVGKVFNSLGTQASPDAIKASKPPPPALFLLLIHSFKP